MGLTLTQLLDEANENLQFDDTIILTTTERENACKKAVQEYSRIRPFYILESYTGVGGDAPFYNLPTAWDEGFSVIAEIEYPVNRVPKEIIRQRYWHIDLRPTGKQLRFGTVNPATGETFYIKFTGRHSFQSSGASNIDEADLVGLSYLATSVMCQMLSTYYAQKANANLPNVDIVEYKDRVAEFQTKSNSWKKKYHQTIKPDLTSTWDNIPFVDWSYWNRTDQ